jgi:transcriptional regulator with XRE-family HTH domain
MSIVHQFQSPEDIQQQIAERAKSKRLRMNITQQELAERSGVSLGSVKRFEQTSDISLKHLLNIALVLDSLDEFTALFAASDDLTIDELIEQKSATTRKRARSNND